MFVRSALILLSLSCTAFGQPPVISDDMIQERVVDLPDEGHKWWFTVVYSDNRNQRDRQLESLIRTDPALRSLVSQTHFTEWESSNEYIKRSDWSEYLGTNRPALLLQTDAGHTADGRGRVVYFASGPHLKIDENLPRSIQRAINAHIADCPRCPLRPQPVPVPQPTPVQPIPPTVPPQVEPQPAQPTEEYVPLWAFLFPVFGAGLGLYQAFKKEAASF